MLEQVEVKWINDYHSMVYNKLSPSLSVEEKAWLKEKTRVI
jgi:Xaa-Pro aminopeptidase